MQTKVIKDPYDQTIIGEVKINSLEEVQAILNNQFFFFNDLKSKKKSRFERIQSLENFIQKLILNRDFLAQLSSKEGVKPISDSYIEIDRAISGVKFCIQESLQLVGQQIPMNMNKASLNHKAYTSFHPRGVVFAISAFNHPVNLIIHQVIPALLVGAPVIIKPASSTPLSCKKIIELLYESGFEQNEVSMIMANHNDLEIILQNPIISFFSFIGSSEIGNKLRRLLPSGCKFQLEHGGIAPLIIDSSARLENELEAMAKASMYAAGQVCISTQKIFIHDSIYDKFKKEFVAVIKKMKVGAKHLAETEIGPIVNTLEKERILKIVEDAKIKGATVLCGGNSIGESLIEATVLENIATDSIFNTQEIFGPVVGLYKFNHHLDLIQELNSVPLAFHTSLYTNDNQIIELYANKLYTSGLLINQNTTFRVDWMPFGGLKNSGHGLGGFAHTMRDMCYEKLIIQKSEYIFE